jgi:hypothetical protein
MKKLILVSLGAIVPFVCSSVAYGPTGHEIVGGIADKLLANTPTAARVNALIDGMTLEKAAVIPDEIKSWDKNGADDPSGFPRYSDHPKIDNQLRDFWRANQPAHDLNSAVPSHHWFHYTDVPVLNAAKYSDGKTGRNKWDIVHMINYCIAVLQGETLENNPRKITKPVAVILLAHYVGDIHQPLHVGAEYFDEAGHAVDPDRGKAGLADEGGNTFVLHLTTGTPQEMTHRALKLHPFWDNEAVMANLPSLPLTMSKEERYEKTERAKRRLIDRFVREEPAAHERLRFTNVHAQHEENRVVAAGVAREKSAPDHVAYADWAAKIVREELHKAGWRLADLLKQVLTPTITNATSALIPLEPMPAEPSTKTETQPSHP